MRESERVRQGEEEESRQEEGREEKWNGTGTGLI